MVGGVVIGVTRGTERTHVHVATCPCYPKHPRGKCPHLDTCSVYTDEIKIHGGERIEISIGDSFWWQSGHCYWTPAHNRNKEDARGGLDYDIELTKIGYSH